MGNVGKSYLLNGAVLGLFASFGGALAVGMLPPPIGAR